MFEVLLHSRAKKDIRKLPNHILIKFDLIVDELTQEPSLSLGGSGRGLGSISIENLGFLDWEGLTFHHGIYLCAKLSIQLLIRTGGDDHYM